MVGHFKGSNDLLMVQAESAHCFGDHDASLIRAGMIFFFITLSAASFAFFSPALNAAFAASCVHTCGHARVRAWLSS